MRPRAERNRRLDQMGKTEGNRLARKSRGECATMIIQQGSSRPPALTVELGSPPADPAKALARMERARRNDQWIQAHWADFLPRALGKFVAVAGEEAFIADSAEEAWAW